MSHFIGKKYSCCQIVGLKYTESIYFSSMIHSYNAPGKMYSFEMEIGNKIIKCVRVTISSEPNSNHTIKLSANLNTCFKKKNEEGKVISFL